jgi:diguanylate cyclase (GGDEF)-like protein
LIRLAENDVLTGLLNRRAFLTRLNALREVHGHCERHAPALVLADIDNFKGLNDNYGHDIGDEALRRTAEVFKDEADNEDGLAARFGGEEFVIALPGRSSEDAMEVAERIRRAIARISITSESAVVQFTSSFGVGEWEANETLESVFKRADTALYRAKKAGRDRVVHAASH